ncbi:hypothetical protein KC19_VG244600 [Ceratodon purpureus]|uniref:Uncharacterized protein n=1 Tax=Ceratodon purpureus TaxID=3225 RepID=A0A8T0HTU6_CERPU|nr:hypothetical protein KC19_VG244600 [Ceratodon purpureus]
MYSLKDLPNVTLIGRTEAMAPLVCSLEVAGTQSLSADRLRVKVSSTSPWNNSFARQHKEISVPLLSALNHHGRRTTTSHNSRKLSITRCKSKWKTGFEEDDICEMAHNHLLMRSVCPLLEEETRVI